MNITKIESFDRIFNAARRGGVVFLNANGGVSVSKNIEEIFAVLLS